MVVLLQMKKLKVLVLLLSLFGFHLSSNGFSTSSHILSKSCPSSVTLLLLIANPSLIFDVITLVGIPLPHLFKNVEKNVAWISVVVFS